MKNDQISKLRFSSRKLVRELGMLQLNKARQHRTPQHWHSLIEISNEPNITTSKLGHLLLLTYTTISRIVNSLLKDGLINSQNGLDKREKHLQITKKGLLEIENIDEFSNIKVRGALSLLTDEEQDQIIASIQKYSDALERSRIFREQVKIHTLSTSRAIRKQIISMIENIQKNEFSLAITDEINSCILKAENIYYYHQSYNFWYAVDDSGTVIGSIGLKKIDAHHAEIKKFFVHLNYRGKGVSQKLMQTLIKSALKHRFKYLYLGTVKSLQAAHRFYEKYGFSRISEKNLPSQFEICPLDTVFYTADCKMLLERISI